MGEFVLLFCRISISFVFIVSSIGHIRDYDSFLQAIKNFQILPDKLIKPSSFLVMSCEVFIPITIIFGDLYSQIGFLLAGFLLCVFLIAIASVLKRKIVTSCNCFGPSKTKLSIFDIVRNFCLILISVCGLCLSNSIDSSVAYNLQEILLITIIAISISTIIMNLNQLMTILQE